MYQQTSTNQYNQQSNSNTQLKEQDWGNLVLSELKRTAREYTTAALEAEHPAIRQTFQTIAQHTMQDQAELFAVLSQLSGYGSIKAADQQEIRQELQQQIQKAEQLQSFVQQAVQSNMAGTGQQQYANTAYQTSQPYQQSIQSPSYPQYSQGGQGQSYGNSYGQSIGSTPGYSQNFNQAIQNTSLGFTQNSNTGYSLNQSSGSQSEVNDYSGTRGSFTGGQDFSSSSTARIGQASMSAAANQDYSTNKYSSSVDTSFSKNAQDNYSSSTAERGGNSFNWSGSDENDSTSASASSQNRSAESIGKSFI
ncbi:spore coat protein [Paenibacillus sp. LMG 31456]|uniref:Spore coat protein n=1 Tax=Paenibacillus foliorum TaxID=2654974 RepID=A0A972GQU8_9BACL|nr:spore coat protein [Paenibacillus foliorum]NOU95164.1 spore coat protein [Paenibacillus foliorum]